MFEMLDALELSNKTSRVQIGDTLESAHLLRSSATLRCVQLVLRWCDCHGGEPEPDGAVWDGEETDQIRPPLSDEPREVEHRNAGGTHRPTSDGPGPAVRSGCLLRATDGRSDGRRRLMEWTPHTSGTLRRRRPYRRLCMSTTRLERFKRRRSSSQWRI